MTISKYLYKMLVLCLLATCSLVLVACSASLQQPQLIEGYNATHRPFDVGGPSNTEEQDNTKPVTLDIVSIGDIIFHYDWMQEYDSAGESIYPEYFRYINDLTSDADLALCNIEAPIAGGELEGYPTFNIGDSIAPAVQSAGFDIVYTSHNHMLDQHAGGVLRTLEVLRMAGLKTVGSRLETTEPNYTMTEVKGVKIALIAYTYESTPNMINGLPISGDMDPHINSFYYGDEDDLAEMKDAIDASRDAGADLVVFYLHAGTEYMQEVDWGQRTTAEFLASNGVDVIFGSHVHVVQTMELLSPADGSAPVPVYWGMGNYISSQIIEGGMGLENEEGIMAQLSLTWNPKTKEIDALTMDYLPLWTCYNPSSDRLKYTTVPERGDVASNESVVATGHLDRAQSAFAEIHVIMGEPLSWQRS